MNADYHRQRAESLLKQVDAVSGSPTADDTKISQWISEATAHATLALALDSAPEERIMLRHTAAIVPGEVFALGPPVGAVAGAEAAASLRQWAADLLYSVDTDFCKTLGPSRQAYVEAANDAARVSLVVTALDRREGEQ